MEYSILLDLLWQSILAEYPWHITYQKYRKPIHSKWPPIKHIIEATRSKENNTEIMSF